MKALEPLAGYARFEFAHADIAHPVFAAPNRHDPPVLLMGELAGFSPGLMQFAARLQAAGYCVYLPWLFGEYGERKPMRNLARLCVSREFGYLRSGHRAPIADWLRALGRHISQQHGQPIGVIGMCLTGGFALALLLDDSTIAAVAAQPSLPLSMLHVMLGEQCAGNGEFPIATTDWAVLRAKLQSGNGALFACRFKADRLCTAEKMQRLRDEFGNNVELHEYGEMNSRNPLGERPHATFTKELRLATGNPAHPANKAFDQLVDFLEKNLQRHAN